MTASGSRGILKSLAPANPLAQKSIKIVASASILAAALGGLFYTTLREGTEY